MRTWISEPVLVTNIVSAVIGLAVVFGLSLPEGLEAAVVALIIAVATAVSRHQVTPV